MPCVVPRGGTEQGKFRASASALRAMADKSKGKPLGQAPPRN